MSAWLSEMLAGKAAQRAAQVEELTRKREAEESTGTGGSGEAEEKWQEVHRSSPSGVTAEGEIVTREVDIDKTPDKKKGEESDDDAPGCLLVNFSVSDLVDAGLKMTGLRAEEKEKKE